MKHEPSHFYLKQTEPNKSCLLVLRSILLQQSDVLTETVKYGMPCFCYGKKPVCYLWTDKKTQEPYILFVEGRQLHHPALETGGRKRMKIFRVNPTDDLPIKTIHLLLAQVLEVAK